MKGFLVFVGMILILAALAMLSITDGASRRKAGTCRSQITGEQLRGTHIDDGRYSRWELLDGNFVPVVIDQANSRDWICMTDKEAGI